MKLVRALGTLWRWLDLDESDFHYYPGLIVLVIGCWLVWQPLALVALGFGLMYPALRAGG